MADPRKNIRALALAPPPPAPGRRSASLQPAERETEAGVPVAGDGRGGPATPAVGGPGKSASRRKQTRSAEQVGSRRTPPPGRHETRTKPTNLYVPHRTRARLAVARTETGVSTIDLILEAVHAQWPHVQDKTPNRSSAVGSLDLPLPRPARRSVPDPTTIQVRLSEAEHAGLSKLARSARVSMSEVVSICVDRHWPD